MCVRTASLVCVRTCYSKLAPKFQSYVHNKQKVMYVQQQFCYVRTVEVVMYTRYNCYVHTGQNCYVRN